MTAAKANLPEAILDRAKIVELKKGDHLFRAGDLVESVYYVESGEIRGIRYNAEGACAVLMRSGAGEFFATASMTLPRFPCDAVAGVNTRVRAFPLVDFLAHLSSDPALGYALTLSLSRDLKKQCARAERLRLKSARERLRHYILCESPNGTDIELGIAISALADELALESETLYRTLADMEKSGEIQREGRRIRLASAAK